MAEAYLILSNWMRGDWGPVEGRFNHGLSKQFNSYSFLALPYASFPCTAPTIADGEASPRDDRASPETMSICMIYWTRGTWRTWRQKMTRLLFTRGYRWHGMVPVIAPPPPKKKGARQWRATFVSAHFPLRGTFKFPIFQDGLPVGKREVRFNSALSKCLCPGH